MSHPSRVRGLKLQGIEVKEALPLVAPFTGAWIEIVEVAMRRFLENVLYARRTLHGCVD